MKIPDRLYDVLKWICIVGLPAISALYFALGGIWNFPYVEQIVGTIAAVQAFLGAILGISTIKYNKEKEIE